MNAKSYLVPFVVALLVFAGGFVLLDALIMDMQGLNLIFHR